MRDLWRAVPRRYYIGWVLGTVLFATQGIMVAQIIRWAGQFTAQSSLASIWVFASQSLLFWILVDAGYYLLSVSKARIIQRVNISLKTMIAEATICQTDAHNSGDAISHITNDAKRIETNYFNEGLSFITSTAMTVVSAVFMLLINPPIALVFLAFAVLSFIPQKIYGKRIETDGQELSHSQARYLSVLKDFLLGHLTLRSFGALVFGRRLVRRELETSEADAFTLTRTISKASAGSLLVTGISFVVPFVIGLFLIRLFGWINIPSLIAIFLASNNVLNGMTSVLSCFSDIRSTKEVRAELGQLIAGEEAQPAEAVTQADRQSPTRSGAEPTVTSQTTLLTPDSADSSTLPASFDEIKIEGLTKQFDGGKGFADKSLLIERGQKILVVGPSGAGKSTFLEVLAGELEPDAGTVSVEWTGTAKDDRVEAATTDGGGQTPAAATAAAPAPTLSQVIGYVRQEPFIFNQPVSFNLTFGDESFPAAAQLAVLQQVGLDTVFGEEPLSYQLDENGGNLSGGQKIRLEVARNLLRHKSLLLLDEVTAALDQETGRKIRALLYSLPLTIVEVAHHYDDASVYDQVIHF